MSKKDWQVGPVLKNKPGSQGTLFRGGTAYSSDARYPRGYTPERQAEVRAAVKPSSMTKHAPPLEAAESLRRVSDTVARSSAPVEHLQGVQWAHVEPGQAITQDDGAAGAYFPARGYREEGMIAVKPEYLRDSTVIHELGHHVSHHHQGNQHERDELGHSGPEEAFADNYAQEHFRDRRGKQRGVGVYGGGELRGHIKRSDSFWDGYAKNRDYSLQRAETDRANEDYYRKYPEEKVHPGNTVQDPLITKEWVHPDDNVQSEIALNEDALPERKWGIQ